MFKLIPRDRPTLGVSEYLSFFDFLATDDEIEKLEERFAKYVGTDYSVAFSSGRLALRNIYKLLADNGEIIVPAFGCMPVADSVIWSRSAVRFSDIDSKSYNTTAEHIKKRINSRTRILAPVHLYGLSFDVDSIIELAEKHKLPVIEDAAMAPGAEYKKKKVGSFGDAAMFSFERSKVFTCYHGAVVSTNSEKLYNQLKESEQALAKKLLFGRNNLLHLYAYDFVMNPYVWKLIYNFWVRRHSQGTTNVGISETEPQNYENRFTGVQAKVAIKQLKKVDGFIAKRRRIAKFFNRHLSGIKGLTLPYEPDWAKHIYARYVLRLEDDFGMTRDELKKRLLEYNIDAGYWYIYSLPYTDCYKHIGDKCPNALDASRRTLALPIYPTLRLKEARRVVDAMREITNS